MNMKILFTPVVLLLVVAFSGVRDVDFVADGLNPNTVSLSWSVGDEQGISSYRIERKMENDTHFRAVRNCENISVGTKYECLDDNLYKSASQQETVVYRLYANLNSEKVLLDEKAVGYTTNAVRRTWGNIKSMFQ